MRWSALLVCLLFVPGVAAQSYETESRTIESHDGIDINTRIYLPEVTPAPAILLTHGWNDNIDVGNTLIFAQRYAELGYVVLTYDSRGWGKSGGEVEMNGPNEVKDTQALITYLSTLDIVIQDGPNDPRVGMIGQSYAGGIQVLTAQVDPRIDAIAPFATWSNLLASLAPNDVTKRGWVDLLFGSGQFSARGVKLGETNPANFDPNLSGPMTKLTQWYAEIVATNGASEEVQEELGVIRSLQPGALNTPTFLVQGWPDTLFTPDDALMTFNDLRARGVDTRIAFIHGGHGFGNYASSEPVMTQADAFFAQYLRDEAPSLAPYPVLRYRYAEDDVVGELQWPPAGTSGSLFYITDDGLSAAAGSLDQTLMVPPMPAYCTEVANFQDEAAAMCGRGIDGTFHTFMTPALEVAQEVTGSAQLVLPIKSSQTDEVFLFFQLVDVAPDGSESSVLAQVTPWRAPAATASVFVALPTISHTFEVGHSIGVKITTTDLGYHGAREPGQVDLGGATPALVLLPMTPKDSHGDRVKPTIDRISSFGQAIESEPDGTQTLRFDVRDNLGLGTIDVTGDGAEVSTVLTPGLKHQTLTVTAVAPVCDAAVIQIQVADLAGNNVTKSFAVVPCPAVEPVIVTPMPPDKKSPGGWLLLPLLAAAFLRRRVA